jgi:Flp pilus assembly protein TadG
MQWFQRVRRGVSLVEFALLTPIVLVTILGLIEVGFIVHSYVAITNVAREGARAGSVLLIEVPDSIVDPASQRSYADAQRSAVVKAAVSSAYDAVFPRPLGMAPYFGTLDPNSDVSVIYSTGSLDNPLRTRELFTVEVKYHYQLVYGLMPIPPLNLTARSVMRIE